MTLYEQHILEGKVKDKQDVLIKQLSKKFTLSGEEKEIIREIEDPEILDQGLDEILFAETKEQVLRILQ